MIFFLVSWFVFFFLIKFSSVGHERSHWKGPGETNGSLTLPPSPVMIVALCDTFLNQVKNSYVQPGIGSPLFPYFVRHRTFSLSLRCPSLTGIHHRLLPTVLWVFQPNLCERQTLLAEPSDISCCWQGGMLVLMQVQILSSREGWRLRLGLWSDGGGTCKTSRSRLYACSIRCDCLLICSDMGH